MATRSNCKPRMLCGRKVWVAERGGDDRGSLKEIWVHLSPFMPAAVYLKGSSLTDGDDDSAYLEGLCKEAIERAIPLNQRLEEIWDADTAEQEMEDAYCAQELAELAELDPSDWAPQLT